MTPFLGWRVANVGGNSNNGTQVGAFTLNLNNDSSNANSNISARLANALRFLATPVISRYNKYIRRLRVELLKA